MLGEWDGERTFYGGDLPARRPLSVLVGDPECIEFGERPGLPVVIDQSADCAPVLPNPCYGPEETVFALTNILDCVFAKNSADIIAAAYTSLAAAQALVQTLLGPDAVVTIFNQPNATTPAGVIAVVGDTAILWLTGTTNFQQLALQSFYFATGPINQGPYSASAIYEAAAFRMADELTAAGAAAAARTVLVGHSYGGAVCMVLAAKMLNADPNKNVEIMTFGAPAAGDARLIDLLATSFQTHYANENDPVPYMPPSGLLFAGLVIAIGPVLALLWPTFARATQVRTVTEDGKIISQVSTDLPNDLITIASLAIAAGLDAPAFKNHRIDWYAYFLCNACKCVPRPCIEPPEPQNFVMGIEIYSYTFLGVGKSNFINEGTATIVHTSPVGVPDVWQKPDTKGFGTNGGIMTLEATVDILGNYTAFRLYFDPVPVDPTWLCYWDFTASQVMSGLHTLTLPTFFNAPLPGDGFFGVSITINPIP